MNNQGVPPAGFYPPGPGFNTQPVYYQNTHPQPQPMAYPYPAQQQPGFSPPPYPINPASAPELIPPPPYNTEYQPPITEAPVFYVQPTSLGPYSARLTCPNCQADVSTRVDVAASTKTHVFAVILCLLGLCLCIPCAYCSDCFAESKHFCPACNSYLGSHVP